MAGRGSSLELAPVSDPLERLFLRCHRDELLPLAALVRVAHEGVGLSLLASNLARATRRLSRHALVNALFSRGEGPEWTEVLAGLVGHPVGFDEIEEAELEVLRAVEIQRWGTLAPDARRALWTQLALQGEPPEAGEAALTEARSQLGRTFGYAVTQAHATLLAPRRFPWFMVLAMVPGCGCVLRPVLVGAALLSFGWFLRADRARLQAMVLHVASLRQRVLRRITIGLVGSPSTGKDAGIRALFGIDSGNISPIAGSTRTVNIQRVPGATALFVVNTPGLGDVVEAVTDEAREVLRHIDVYLYVVNAEGGVQAREQADYRACLASGRPVLALVNKIDLLRPRDKERYLDDARAKLGAPEDAFLPVAFDPMPELSPTPLGLAEVRAWLVERLVELGKDPDELPRPGG